MTLMYGIDYFVYLVDLPISICGFTEMNSDGTYTIVINRKHSRERQDKTLLHEILHIKLGHFDRDQEDKSVEKKELEVAEFSRRIRDAV